MARRLSGAHGICTQGGGQDPTAAAMSANHIVGGTGLLLSFLASEVPPCFPSPIPRPEHCFSVNTPDLQ